MESYPPSFGRIKLDANDGPGNFDGGVHQSFVWVVRNHEQISVWKKPWELGRRESNNFILAHVLESLFLFGFSFPKKKHSIKISPKTLGEVSKSPPLVIGMFEWHSFHHSIQGSVSSFHHVVLGTRPSRETLGEWESTKHQQACWHVDHHESLEFKMFNCWAKFWFCRFFWWSIHTWFGHICKAKPYVEAPTDVYIYIIHIGIMFTWLKNKNISAVITSCKKKVVRSFFFRYWKVLSPIPNKKNTVILNYMCIGDAWIHLQFSTLMICSCSTWEWRLGSQDLSKWWGSQGLFFFLVNGRRLLFSPPNARWRWDTVELVL